MRRTTALEQIPARKWEGVAPSTRMGRFVGTVTCLCCGRSDEWTASRMPSPEIVPGKFRDRGWVFKNRGWTCPDCHSGNKQEEEKAVISRSPAPNTPVAILSVPEAAAPPEPTDAAKSQRRLVYMALEDGYDEKAKTYKPGVTDATIAKDVGCAEKLVATVRTDFFGPAAPPMPPEVAELLFELQTRKEIQERLVSLIDDERLAVDKVWNRLVALCKEKGWSIPKG